MMSVWKWIGIVVGGLLAVVLLTGTALHFVGMNRLNNAPQVATAPLAVDSDPESIARGRQLAGVSACAGCHGADLAGDVFIDEAPIGYVPAANLTPGAGGIGASYSADDWARAIRHGMAADGRSLLMMPSYHYDAYSDADLADLIAYLQSLAPVDNDPGARRIDFPGSIIFGVLAFDDVTSVNQIDHARVGGTGPAIEAGAAYGAYLAEIASCGSCHGEALTGATNPDSPQGPNITPAGALQAYTPESFKTAMRTGMTPGGYQLSPEMPWPSYSAMSDTQLDALWAHLNGLPETATP